MCGVFGIAYGPGGAAAEPWTPSELMEICYPAIIHRGRHAWGYMLNVRGVDEVPFFKQEGSAVHVSAAASMKLEDGLDLTYLACHVRHATNGSPRYQGNNHPILHGDIIGMHNGVLREWQPILDELGREDPKAEVDSEAIMASINRDGVKDGLKRIQGDMVTVFTDLKEPGVLYIARTHGRPLVYGTTEAGSLIWASEAAVIRSTGIKLVDDKLHNWNETNRWMKIVNGAIVERKQFRKAEPKIVTPPAPVRPTAPTFTRWEPRSNPSNVLGARQDKYGGSYIGANMYRVTMDDGSTKMLDGEDYITWAVEREVARRMEEARATVKRARDRQRALRAAKQEAAAPTATEATT